MIVVVFRSGVIFYEWMYDMKIKQSNRGIQTKAYPTGNIRQRLIETWPSHLKLSCIDFPGYPGSICNDTPILGGKKKKQGKTRLVVSFGMLLFWLSMWVN